MVEVVTLDEIEARFGEVVVEGGDVVEGDCEALLVEKATPVLLDARGFRMAFRPDAYAPVRDHFERERRRVKSEDLFLECRGALTCVDVDVGADELPLFMGGVLGEKRREFCRRFVDRWF